MAPRVRRGTCKFYRFKSYRKPGARPENLGEIRVTVGDASDSYFIVISRLWMS